MGEVWRAADEELQRAVAVKILRDEVTGTESVGRLRREAAIGARIRHPAITMVHDIGRDDDRLFIVMELLEGRDLSALISESRDGLPVAESVSLGMQIADGLAAAHGQGIVHRDLKPANVFLHQGRVKICDFGLSRTTDSTTGLTHTGQPFGTPLYMAPEQWRGEHVDARCDLYALGCILYAMLTGLPPFTGGYYALMRRHIDEAPRPPRAIRPEIPPALESLVLALLAKDPRARPADAHAARAALGDLTGSPASTQVQVPARPDRPEANEVPATDDAVTARDLYEALAADRARVLGPDHPDTLTARHNHAYWVAATGDPGTARDLFHSLVTDRVRLLGPDHRDTISTRDNHANQVGFGGDPVTARDLYVDVVADYARILGPDHRNTLTARHNHAYWVAAAGDAIAARDLYKDVAADRVRLLGPDHPDTLTTRAQWADAAARAAR